MIFKHLLNNFIVSKLFLYLHLVSILLLVTLPLNTSSELNNITILQLRGDYFFHILMFLPWAFFRKAFTKPAQSKSPQLNSSLPNSISQSLCHHNTTSESSPLTSHRSPLTSHRSSLIAYLSCLNWLLLGLLFAAGSEVLQYLLPWRAYNVNDLLANMLGILVGFTLLFLFNIRQKTQPINTLTR